MNFKSHLTSGIVTGVIAAGSTYYGIEAISNIVSSIEGITNVIHNKEALTLVTFILTFLGNIVPDIDNPKSHIGKLFFPLSYLIAFLGFLIYPFFYPKKYRAIMSSKGFRKGFFIIHRFILHTDIGLIIFFGLFHLLKNTLSSYLEIPYLFYVFFVIGYFIHLILDRTTSKMPRFVIHRLFSKITGIGKQREVW